VAQITFKGKAIRTSGDLPRKGRIPPPFTLVKTLDGPMRGLLARSVVVVDEKGVVIHTELVPDIGQEPDYDGVEAVLK